MVNLVNGGLSPPVESERCRIMVNKVDVVISPKYMII